MTYAEIERRIAEVGKMWHEGMPKKQTADLLRKRLYCGPDSISDLVVKFTVRCPGEEIVVEFGRDGSFTINHLRDEIE